MIDISELLDDIDRYAQLMAIPHDVWQALSHSQKVKILLQRQLKLPEPDKTKTTGRQMADIGPFLAAIDSNPEAAGIPHSVWQSLNYAQKGKALIQMQIDSATSQSSEPPAD